MDLKVQFLYEADLTPLACVSIISRLELTSVVVRLAFNKAKCSRIVVASMQ